MAKQGFPRMGISACFGGPFFIILLKINAVKTFFLKDLPPFYFSQRFTSLLFFSKIYLPFPIFYRVTSVQRYIAGYVMK